MELIRILDEEHLEELISQCKSEPHPEASESSYYEKYRIYDIPIVFSRDGKIMCSNNWFVNNSHELIYDIEKNNWVNLKMYWRGESYVKDIYLVQ